MFASGCKAATKLQAHKLGGLALRSRRQRLWLQCGDMCTRGGRPNPYGGVLRRAKSFEVGGKSDNDASSERAAIKRCGCSTGREGNDA